MNVKNQQRGFTTTVYIFAILLAVIAAGGYLIYKERQGLMETIAAQSDKIAQQEATIASLEAVNRELLGKNETLNKQIELLQKINKDNDEERSIREKKLRDLEAAYKNLSAKLPTVLSDDQVAKPTDLELKNSALRIEYLWNIYRIDFNTIDRIPNTGHHNPPPK